MNIFVSVGTSLLENICREKPNLVMGCRYCSDNSDKASEIKNCKFDSEKTIELLSNHPELSAEYEILQLLKDHLRYRLKDSAVKNIFLFYTADLRNIVKIIEKAIEKHLFSSASTKLVEIEDGYNVNVIWQKITEVWERVKEEDIIVVPIGGYKTITGTFMMFSMINGYKSYYKHESAQNVVELPPLPISVDLQRLVFYSCIKKGEFLPIDSAWKFREAFLYKEPTLYYIKDKNLRRVATDVIKISSNLWIGDLIPETVEHSKNHSRRILDKFRAIYDQEGNSKFNIGCNDNRKDDTLFLFVASAYLHDVGHTQLFIKSENGIVSLKDYPEIVRNMHHLLSAYLILSNEDIIDAFKKLDERYLIAVALISAYHRKKMHLTGKENESSEIFENISKSVQELFSEYKYDIDLKKPLYDNLERFDEDFKESIMKAAILLKLIDEMDVQADRIIDEYYLKARKRRIDNEILLLKGLLKKQINENDNECSEYLEKLSYEMKNGAITEQTKNEIYKKAEEEFINGSKGCWAVLSQLVFKYEQFKHFEKHRSIWAVVPKIKMLFENTYKLSITIKTKKDGMEAAEDVKKDINEQFEMVKKEAENYLKIKDIEISIDKGV